MTYVTLKPGKDKPIRHYHHWIFSGAIQSLPSFSDGSLLPVQSAEGVPLGYGYFNRKSSIIGRMLSFDPAQNPLDALKQSIDDAIYLRKNWFNESTTDGYRLINGEGDRLPGLIVDRYSDLFVIQISTLGMEYLKPEILKHLATFHPSAIYEKSLLPSRKEEGLAPFEGWQCATPILEQSFIENGLNFIITPEQSQKTGFFLDHREMRQLVRTLSKEKRVLNAFCYTGGFTVYALAGGATRVDSVDISEPAIAMAKRHVLLNGFAPQEHAFIQGDVFQFLRDSTLNYDLVILDPPAFAKKKKDIVAACRGYKDINRLAMQKMPPKSLLLTCSCSHYVDGALFQQVVFQAAAEAQRRVKILGHHRLGADHPVNLFHPEGSYLKSLLLWID